MSTNNQTSRSKIAMIEWMAAASYIPLPSPPTNTHNVYTFVQRMLLLFDVRYSIRLPRMFNQKGVSDLFPRAACTARGVNNAITIL